MTQVPRHLARGAFAALVLVVLQGCADGEVITGQASDPPTGSATAVDATPTAGGSSTSEAPAATSPSPAAPPTSPAAQSPGTPQAKTYRNQAYGFSLTIPAGFTQSSPIGAGRGMAFQGPGGAKLQAYGSNNLQEATASTACAQQGEGMGGRVEIDGSGDRCTLRVSGDGTVRVLVNWVGTGSLNTVDLSYPSAASADLETTLSAVVGSFSPGDLSAEH